MDRSKLAIDGGSASIQGTLPEYPSIGERERTAVNRVIDRGCLSGFYGSWGDHFFGGPEVRNLEQAWSERFAISHAVSVNSATSGLFAAMGAVGVESGDEVIVPPLTMSATAMAPLVYGGIPVFVDVEPETFCLDVEKVRKAITTRTKAILAVNLFGQPADLISLRAIADEHDIALIEDNAQGPLAMQSNRFAGTIGHIGVFSLNYHKHIHAGEGGICATNSEDLYHRLCMIRNHGENVVDAVGLPNTSNLVGFNYRLTELSAAIALAQFEHVDEHVQKRVDLAESLSEIVAPIEGVYAPAVRDDCRHVYYVWAMRINPSEFGCSRAMLSAALEAEGFPHGCGYVSPLYQLPIFRGVNNPLNNERETHLKSQHRCVVHDCDRAESLHEQELIIAEPCQFDCTKETIDALGQALEKVVNQRQRLHQLDAERSAQPVAG